nr:hypothetical protein [Escherichia coli]
MHRTGCNDSTERDRSAQQRDQQHI